MMILFLFALSGKTLEWSGEKLNQWKAAGGMQITANGSDTLLLTPAKPGASLEFHGALNSADYDYLEVEFKALQLPERNNGKLLFTAQNKPYSSKQVVWFERLKTTANFTMIRVPLNKAWAQYGQVGKMRLSIPNQIPAKVELKAIRLVSVPKAVPVNGILIWSGKNGFADWRNGGGAEISINNDGIMTFNQTRPGGWIEYTGGEFEAADFDYLEVEYRGKSLPARNNGKLLFAAPGKPYSSKQVVWFENLRPSPEFKTLRVKLNNKQKSFLRCGKISRMRLSIPNQAPAEVEIRSIRLLRAEKVTTNPGRQYLFQVPENGKLAVNIPVGNYKVYLQTLGGKASAKSIKFQTHLKNAGHKIIRNGSFQYQLLGECDGGKISLTTTPDGCRSGILFCAKNTLPGGFPEEPFFPQVSGMGKTQPLKAELPVAYFSGYIVRAALDHPGYTSKGLNQFVFRKSFQIPAGIKKAQLQISADDRFMLTLNGKKISELHTPDGWRTPQKTDITALLNPGENLLEGIYQNIGGPGGVLVEVEYIDANGKYFNFGTDKSFVFAGKKENNWQLDNNYTAFTAGVEQSTPPHPPWTTQLPFEKLSLTLPEHSLNHRLVSENGKNFWEFDCNAAAAIGTKIVLTLQDTASTAENPRKLMEKTVTLSGKNLPEKGKFRFQIDLPEYYPSARLKLRAFSGKINWGEPGFEFDFHNSASTGKELDCRLVDGKVMLNGKAVYPVIGNTYHSFAPANYHLAKVNFRTAWSIFWVGENKYDFTDIDAKVNEILSLDENVVLWLFPSVNAPAEWGENHPDERVCYFDGSRPHLNGGLASFASQKYRQDAAKALRKFIEHVQNSGYADKVAGYLVAGGYTDEFQHWDAYRGNPKGAMLDYSPAAQREFARFISVNAPELSPVLPTPAERITAGSGMLLDPVADKKVFLHSRFHSEIIADTIAYLIKEVRKCVGDGKLLGVYYGYPLEYANMGFKVHNSGHNALEKVLQIKELNALFSPPSYGVRNLGESGEDMKPYASIRRAGKLSIIDDDTRTHMIRRPVGFYQTVNAVQTRNIVRRNLGRTLCRMEPLSLFSLTSGNEFSSKETVEDIQTFRRISEFALDNNSAVNAEIAVVVSENGHHATTYCDTFDMENPLQQLYHGDGRVYNRPRSTQKLTAPLIYYQRNQIARMGAPADILLAEALTDVEKLPYKLYIFLNLFAPDAKTVKAVNTLRAAGKKLLFCYAPGGTTASGAEFAGFKLKRLPAAVPILHVSDRSHGATMNLPQDLPSATGKIPLFAAENTPDIRVLGTYPGGETALAANGNSVFCGVPALSPDFLRSLAMWAGVHIYSSTNDVLYANTDFVTFHAATAGRKTIHLPQPADVVEVFSGRVIARNCRSFSFEAKLHESFLFYCGNADKLPAGMIK